MADRLVFYHNPTPRGRIVRSTLEPRPTIRKCIDRCARRAALERASG